jgi:hypothetical protein
MLFTVVWLALRPRGRQITAVPQAQIGFGVRRNLLLDLAGWPALSGGWWLCAVGRPTQKPPYYQEGMELETVVSGSAGWEATEER